MTALMLEKISLENQLFNAIEQSFLSKTREEYMYWLEKRRELSGLIKKLGSAALGPEC